MYFVGFLFGLGFDTATEIALLGISAYSTNQQMPVPFIMIFPLLFTAGMCLIDATSGSLILKACRWAYINPARKLYYNLIITLFILVITAMLALYEIFALFIPNNLDRYFEILGIFLLISSLSIWFFFRLSTKRKTLRITTHRAL
jgi:HoxN/HupN/NixA family high-affinity nickel-transporter